jgi:hypothetical protein
LGASVFPDGFLGLFGLCTVEPVLPDPTPVVPVVPPVAVPVPLPLIDAPPVEPPVEPPAAPPACASANVLDSANAVARAMVVSFMVISFWLLRRPTRHKRLMFRALAKVRLHTAAIAALANLSGF